MNVFEQYGSFVHQDADSQGQTADRVRLKKLLVCTWGPIRLQTIRRSKSFREERIWTGGNEDGIITIPNRP